jgi:RNA polymerase sigma factor (sigma-70 family)
VTRADRTLDALLAKLAKKPSLERLLVQYTRRYSLPREAIADAIQLSFCKVLKFHAGKASDLQTLEQVERFLHTVIRNTLIDEIRRTDVIRFVELDEDYVALLGGTRSVADSGKTGNAETEVLESAPPETITQADEDDASIGTIGRGIRRQGPPSLEDTMVDVIDTRTLVRQLLLQLDPKYRHVVVLLLIEWTPEEISGKFGQNGYRLRVWAHVKICRILASLAAVGHELAERLHAQGGCHRILQSIQGGAAPTTA